jgi:hypothetical protein
MQKMKTMTSFHVGIIVGVGYILRAIQTKGHVKLYFRPRE